MKYILSVLRWPEEVAQFTLMHIQGNWIPSGHPQSMASNEFRLEDGQSKYDPTLLAVALINITSAALAFKMYLPNSVKRNELPNANLGTKLGQLAFSDFQLYWFKFRQ